MSAAEGFVVAAGGGRHFDSPTPGRCFAMKLLGRETNESRRMAIPIRPDGTVHAPDRPGLGFTLRADALERFRYVDGPEYEF